jgi:hypothetical protein
MTGSDKNTVAKDRADLEARGEIHHVKIRTDTKGRKQPARKPLTKKVAESEPKPEPKPPESQYERDRKACMALNQGVTDAERALAQWHKDHPEDTALHEFERKLTDIIRQGVRMIGKADPARIAKSNAFSPDEVEQYKEFLAKVVRAKRAAAGKRTSTDRVIPDDLTIPGFLNRTPDGVTS